MDTDLNEMHYHYKDILSVFLDAFIEDFDCKDVEDSLRSILTKREIDFIISSNQTNVSIYLLFWKLLEKPESIVQRFVEEVLNYRDGANYDFLMTPIKAEYLQPSTNTRLYVEQRDRLFNDNQAFSKYNVPRLKPYLALTKALLELRPAKNVLVDGPLGAGKQWLVLDVCSSYKVQQKMDFKIFWLNVKSCNSPETDLEMLLTLLYQIEPNWSGRCDSGSWNIMQRIDSVKVELRRLLKSKPYENCLLVLRNVQSVRTWKAFNLGCKILLTTRYKVVTDYLSAATTKHVPLKDALTEHEAESLIVKYLHCRPEDLPREVLTTNPRSLSIIAESIRDGLATWENWRDVNCNKLTSIIESSLKVLEPVININMFDKLFIFPPSAHIPIHLLSLVWSDDKSDSDDPMVVVNKLHRYSLVEKQSQQSTISIPAIYLELKLEVDNAAALHRRIVDYYNITKAFDDDDDLTVPFLDGYFYCHIGHHLTKLQHAESVALFRKIFLDFRFLEQKIRHDTTAWNASGSILNTLQQLKFYSSYIIDNDPKFRRLLNALLDFLPKIEESLIRSKFTRLLRIALMAEEEAIYEEAYRQVQRFGDQVWFTEHGRFHQHRQIINLGQNEVRHALYLNNDFCLMALASNQMLLTDVSLEAEDTYLLKDDNDSSDILKMAVFNQQKHLLTLHSNGSVKLWSLWAECFGRRHSSGSRQRVRPPHLAHLRQYAATRTYKQLVNGIAKRAINSYQTIDQSIVAFHLNEAATVGDAKIQLHVVFSNGDVCICEWDDRDQVFKSSNTPTLKTQQLRVRCFVQVLNRYYVMCTADCTLTVWDLNNGSGDKPELSGYDVHNDPPLAIEAYNERSQHSTLLLIHRYSVWRLTFEPGDHQQPLVRLQSEPVQLPDMSFINCAKGSADGRYLILGTSVGLIVYDIKLSDPVLRSNVSEHIDCVDIYELCDPIYKYIVLCGAKGKRLLHVHTLRKVSSMESGITWVHNVDETRGMTRACLEPNVYLRSLLDMTSRRSQLLAVDSKERIHQIETTADPSARRRSSISSWSTITPTHAASKTSISAISAHDDDHIYVGYMDGVIIDVNRDVVLKQQFITEPIDYLKQINAQLLVASARVPRKTVIFRLQPEQPVAGNGTPVDWPIQLELYTKYSCLLGGKFLLLFSDHGVFQLDISNPLALIKLDDADEPLVGFDIKNGLLFLAYGNNTIEVSRFIYTDTRLLKDVLCSTRITEEAKISYLIATDDACLFALGFESGLIELYSLAGTAIQLVYSMREVHEYCIRQLRFSPCKLLLVSCAEQLCFWNVTHMRNNQVESQLAIRRSRRHKLYSVEQEDAVDAAPIVSDMSEPPPPQFVAAYTRQPMRDTQPEAELWRNKRGNAIRPELLACIKFVGNTACQFFTDAKFSQFYAIDDEGVYYHLQLLEAKHPRSGSPSDLERAERLSSEMFSDLQYANLEDIRIIEPTLTIADGIDDVGADVVGDLQADAPLAVEECSS
ncbi:uncharacterized protein LOC117582565 [Drosophila guanche]|uniref:Blast:Apoptotic protease-activating factor 1 n=1 Tax=Drosophila guanche TaxID=7266 RepID=A0A3B0J549_DROGU|nr:uncharacterized protein LOC117582565 [Drosophila guanche]XP_034126305.1 uncharacterized protein LOC117582565 [Drosophila guanche]SPP74793.1 blast:Apoptotic protease-activating factor 1 [Drosophila guanche]